MTTDTKMKIELLTLRCELLDAHNKMLVSMCDRCDKFVEYAFEEVERLRDEVFVLQQKPSSKKKKR